MDRRFFHHDHLGSVVEVTDELGDTVEEHSYDAWGQRRSLANDVDVYEPFADPNVATPQGQLSERYSEELGTDRGFTGHEMLDHLGLVHMNARIYDPVIGRFLSADTVVQSPDNLQSHNRYAYVLNNPLSYTDPTGHFVFVLAAIALIKFGLITNFALQIAVVFVAGMADAYVQGARGSDLFRAGLAAAVTYVAAAGIGKALGHSMQGDPSKLVESGEAMVDMGSRGAQEFTRAAAHGVTGGTAAEIQGGDFGSGFASSFAASASGSALGASGAEGSAWYGTTGNIQPQMITRTAIAAAVGGTVAEIGGGKFGNGATTAAIQHLVNAEGVEAQKKAQAQKAKTVVKKDGVTYVTVRVRFQDALGNVLLTEKAAVEQPSLNEQAGKLRDGFESMWTGSDGDVRYEGKMVVVTDRKDPNVIVATVNYGTGRASAVYKGTSINFYMDDDAWTSGHEFGHSLGLIHGDEGDAPGIMGPRGAKPNKGEIEILHFRQLGL